MFYKQKYQKYESKLAKLQITRTQYGGMVYLI